MPLSDAKNGAPAQIDKLLAGQLVSLAEVPLPRALAVLANQGASGSLELKLEPYEKTIVLKSGAPVSVESNIAEEALDKYLLHRGELNEEQALAAMTKATISGRAVGEVLVEMGILRPDQLFPLLKRSLGARILSAFRWDRGTMFYNSSASESKDVLIKVAPAPLVFRGVCSFSPLPLVESDFGDPTAKYHILASAKNAMGDLRYNTVESRVVNTLARPNTREELAASARVEIADATRIIYALHLLGIATIANDNQTGTPIEETSQDRTEKKPRRRRTASIAPSAATLQSATPIDAATLKIPSSAPAETNPLRAASVQNLSMANAQGKKVPSTTIPPTGSQAHNFIDLPGKKLPSTTLPPEMSSGAATVRSPTFLEAPAKKAPATTIPPATASGTQRTTTLPSTTIPPSSVASVEPSAPPKQESPKPLTREELAEIAAAYDAFKSGDYFQMLNVKTDETFDGLRAAFLLKCDKLSPMSFRGRNLGNQKERLEEMFLGLVKAFSTLAVPSARKEYIAQRRDLTARPESRGENQSSSNQPNANHSGVRARQANRNAFSVDEPSDATASVRTAITFINNGQSKEAVSVLAESLREDPADATAMAFLGYALYMVDPTSRLKDAVKSLERASLVNPRCLDAFVLLGRILDFEQDRAKALASYRAALRVRPGHPEARDAVARLEKLVSDS